MLEPSSDLIAKPRDQACKDKKLTCYMESNMIPKHPFSLLFTAPSGSGKSTLLLHMLEHPRFYGNYFDPKNIFIYSMTSKCDPLYKDVNIPDKNIYTDNFQTKLNTFMKKRKSLVEKKGKENTDPVLIIFEDSTNQKKFMRSRAFLDAFVLLRHYNCSLMSVVHKFNSVERTARLSVGHIIVFPCTSNEAQCISDDFCPPGLPKKEFKKLLYYCFSPTEHDSHPFLYINNKVPYSQRYRKGFYEMLELQ